MALQQIGVQASRLMAIVNAQPSPRGHSPEARRWLMGGRVQGVGYRAFVFNLAQRFGLSGVVQNLVGEVLVEAQGEAAALDAFAAALVAAAPPLSRRRCRARRYFPASLFRCVSWTVLKFCSVPSLHKPISTFLRTTFCATTAAARCLIRMMRVTVIRSSTARNAGRAIR